MHMPKYDVIVVGATIDEKKTDEYIVKNSLGTTPRQITGLLGSLMDLTSGR